jgi:type IV pilus assembly protein PilV
MLSRLARPRFSRQRRGQAGITLIEVLVAMLLLSFGMLPLGAMLSFSVQMPKLAGYRAIATNLASSHVARILANPDGFAFNDYKKPLHDNTWSFDDISLADCAYSDPCTQASLATMDDAATRRAVRMSLPAGDMLLTCDTASCGDSDYGNLWIVWQDPSGRSTLDLSSTDNCPDEVKNAYSDPAPSCFYLRFKV